MSQEQLKNIIEASLMVANQPLSISRLLTLFEADTTLQPDRNDLRSAIEQLQLEYQGRGIEIVEVASGYRVQARNDYAEWINRLFEERPPRYSRALLETLAIIAYRQPITRAEIEDIRGVSVSSSIVKTLQEREWVKVVGHRDVPGKPALLATTRTFLDYFNLKKLSDLPALSDIKDFDAINPDLFEALNEEEQKILQQEGTESEEDSGQDETIEVIAEQSTSETAEEIQQTGTDEEEGDEEEEVQGAQVIPFTT
ncbi:MAG: SMC-Scp complex subunit ScpB [Gammaproteobacteria bacterium]